MNILRPILISSTANITYLTGFSGFSPIEREAFLLITKTNQYIFTDGRYSEAIKNQVPNFNLIEISSNLPILKAVEQTADKLKIKRLAIEENNLTILEYKKLKNTIKNLHAISLRGLRMIKTKEEIAAIEKACGLGDRAFDFILKKLKTGVSEKEITFELEMFIKQHGADLSFSPIVAFGKNSSIPHYLSGNSKLKKGDFVLLDFCIKIDNYCSDMTRTIVFGKASDKQKKMHEAALAAQEKAIEALAKQKKAKMIDKIARDYITNAGFPTIPHSLGHGIGIEVHEAPTLSPNSIDVLKNGMVFSIEPGIYIEGFGGVRIEDLVVLEAGIPRLLTQSPKQLIEL